MDNKTKLFRRIMGLVVILVLGCGISIYGLFDLQIKNGADYKEISERRLTTNLTVTASRGEILDRYGRPLVTNKNVFSIRIDYAYWDKTNQNDTILSLAQIAMADGAEVEDGLPISDYPPFSYIGEETDNARESLEDYAQSNSDLQDGVSATQMIEQLREKYGIDESLSDYQARIVVGVRYNMAQSQFSLFNSYIFARDVSIDAIAKIKENFTDFEGVDIETESVRQYETEYAAHILGRVGTMYKEEWDGENGEVGYKDLGYSYNAIVGKDGMEKALEEYLHGTNGTRAVETNITGNVTNEISAVEPQPGNNCILTIDLELQKAMEDSLKLRIEQTEDATTGAAVAIEVGTGEVLAIASYPTYSLETFNADYNDLYNDPLTPMVNRATSGIYAPGSTYKPVVAAAALEEGVIDLTTEIKCSHSLYYGGQTFNCMGSHGNLNVISALQKSCNIFFYQTGDMLGGTLLEEYAKQFGFGQKTGLELYESRGYVAGPTNRESMVSNDPSLRDWGGGDNLLAAIGQGDNAFTPIQMANYVATIASGGDRYQTHLLKSVKSYDYTETVMEFEPNVVESVDVSESTIEAIKQGMGAVVSEGGTAASIFADYPISLGGKSGTAQVYGKPDNGVFVAFAPFDEPQIAICVVVEGGTSGTNVSPVVRDILDAYFNTDGTDDITTYEYTMVP